MSDVQIFNEDWEEKVREQDARVRAAKKQAEDARRRIVSAVHNISRTQDGKAFLDFLRTQVCGAHLYPVFDDARKEHFYMARRWVWGQVEALLNENTDTE
ncbi:MAG: hypothetical protein IJX22_06025 [Opitutales bacterium]|nr:hypothetical protein [Opitutales bacterium]MBQ9759250.1 hypothetical protein [Opitutales bacterium]